VSVTPDLERAYAKFQLRSDWRRSGWSPIGIAMHRVGPVAPLPVATWSASPPWMQPGTEMLMLTPRDDTKSPSLSVHPEGPKHGAAHPIGVLRITAARIIAPQAYEPIDALTYLAREHVIGLDRGAEWTLDLTFDDGAQGKSKDFRPELPLRIHY
jgi:hypothetical protein